MKIGILCEGEFTDEPVLKRVLEHIFPSTQFYIKGVSKSIIFQTCDLELKEMFESDNNETGFKREKVDRVLIVWDLLPPGIQMGVSSQDSLKESRGEQKKKLLSLLLTSDQLPEELKKHAEYLMLRYKYKEGELSESASNDLYKLVCICYAFEGWFLSDGGVLQSIASTSHRQAARFSPPDPDRCREPEAVLRRYFRQSPNKNIKHYNKIEHNKVIMEKYITSGKVEKLKKSSSFSRIIEELGKWGCQ